MPSTKLQPVAHSKTAEWQNGLLRHPPLAPTPHSHCSYRCAYMCARACVLAYMCERIARLRKAPRDTNAFLVAARLTPSRFKVQDPTRRALTWMGVGSFGYGFLYWHGTIPVAEQNGGC